MKICDDGKKNFCWECHWSNEEVRKNICVNSDAYPTGFPIGKYNGHLDTIDYRDERWGLIEIPSDYHEGKYQILFCLECHPQKNTHTAYPGSGYGRRKRAQDSGVQVRYSMCVFCHNPHGSGDEKGNANVFMFKGNVYKYLCNNCHFSQFKWSSCSPYPPPGEFGSYTPIRDEDTWFVNFIDPLKQDIREPDSPVNSPTIPSDTTDVCEICHQSRSLQYWPKPGGLDGYQHRNGSRHYFNPDNVPCPDPDACTIDYRGTDCTGCHIHDPILTGDPDNPLVSKGFSTTCRCQSYRPVMDTGYYFLMIMII